QLRGPYGQAPGAGGREGGQGDAPQELPRPQDARQTQGLRGPNAPAPGATAAAVRDPADFPVAPQGSVRKSNVAEPTGVETPADETAYFDTEYTAEDEFDGGEESAPSEYTTESPEGGAQRAARRPVITGHASGLGRRKEAIARVRIVPGTGQWKINGRPLEAYFPNKVHQQIVSEPFVTLGAEGKFDVIARIGGGGVSGQAGALRLGVARA